MSPFSQTLLRAAVVLAATQSRAQTIQIGGLTVAATKSNVAPAGEKVATKSNATAAYFAAETVQLTDGAVANLTALSLTNSTLLAFGALASAKSPAPGTCKVFPGDATWPGPEAWNALGLAVGPGLLIPTVPIAAPCYVNSSWPGAFDAARCAVVASRWSDSTLHMEDPTSSMWPLYQGRTCLPPDAGGASNNTATALQAQGNCTLGGYPNYAVDAQNVAAVQLAVNFARNANVRLVVRNTGHDFNGRSLGAGSLAVWTHRLKDVAFLPDHKEGNYRGPAMKLGAGVQAFEMYEAADRYNVTAVGGEGSTVGVMGGYIAGGGHSPLSPVLGMAADQVLSIEVVTADGRFVTANEVNNPDLFWALRGGGGSTFGVVTSVVVKVYPKMPVTTLAFSFSTSANVSADTFWTAVSAFFDNFPLYVDFGAYTYFTIIPTGPGNFVFNLQPFFGANLTAAQVSALTTPWTGILESLGIAFAPNLTEHAAFYPAWHAAFPQESVGRSTGKTASRLFPRANWLDPARKRATFDAVRDVVANGSVLIAFNIAANPWANPNLYPPPAAAADPSSDTATASASPAPPSPPENAVNPAWRTTVLHAIANVDWDAAAAVSVESARATLLSKQLMQPWRDAAPNDKGGGAYASEGDVTEPDFRAAFYGDKYQRLYGIKQRYDAGGVFYAVTAVGSEDWEVQGGVEGIPFQTGKLCRRTMT